MNNFIVLLARIFLAAIFIRSGINKLLNPEQTQGVMESQGIPFAGFLLWVTVIVLLAGGLSVLLGYKSKLGAWLLVGFLIPTTLIFHTDFADRSEQIAFFKNLGLMGGLLMITAFGGGGWSWDQLKKGDSTQKKSQLNKSEMEV